MFKHKFRRRNSSLTNYKRRLALVKSDLDRVVVRESNTKISAQIVGYTEKGDIVKASADSLSLKTYEWPSRANRPTAYLTGMLLAKNAKKLGNHEYVLDVGLSASTKGSIPFVFAKGCVDNGLRLKGTFNMESKLYDGSQIAKFAAEKQKNKAQFTGYSKDNVKVFDLPDLFQKVAQQIKSAK